MNIGELENAVSLQKRSYALLLWMGKNASHFLDERIMSSSRSCLDWLKVHLNHIPLEIRPGPDELDPFSKMLTSYFNTSFHLNGAGANARLVRGRKFKDGRNKKYAQGRAAEAAAELSRLAVRSLAQEENLLLTDEIVSGILMDEAIADDVSLWAYGCEMVRRSQFASQGPAVHHLWLELDEKKRRRLDAEDIWKARSRLIKEFTRKAAQYAQQ